MSVRASFLVLCLFFCLTTIAQEEKDDKPIIYGVHFGGFKPWVPETPEFYDDGGTYRRSVQVSHKAYSGFSGGVSCLIRRTRYRRFFNVGLNMFRTHYSFNMEDAADRRPHIRTWSFQPYFMLERRSTHKQFGISGGFYLDYQTMPKVEAPAGYFTNIGVRAQFTGGLTASITINPKILDQRLSLVYSAFGSLFPPYYFDILVKHSGNNFVYNSRYVFNAHSYITQNLCIRYAFSL